MKIIILTCLLVLFYGCGSESITKDGIVYSDKGMHELLKKEQLLLYAKRILEKKCEDLSKKEVKIDNQKLVNEIRTIYPKFIPTGSMADGVSTPSNDATNNAEAIGYGVSGKAGLVGIAIAGMAELYQDSQNKPILEDPKVKKIISKYEKDFYNRKRAYISSCMFKITDVSIDDWEIRTHFFRDDTTERDIEIDYSVNGKDDDVSWSQVKR